MTLSPQWLDELRARTVLSSLIGRSVKIVKAGREFRGCCPFHNEKTPSFYVNDEKGFYHCFGCSAHGDAIRWLTDQRGLPFMDAVKELAQAAGMDVPAADPRSVEKAERSVELYDVMTAAQRWFVMQLEGSGGADARDYLARRGIDQTTVTMFGLGFAPDARGRLKADLAHFGNDRLIEAGLLISVDDKEPYDRFRGRLMIPIRDPRGRVIAFGGRIIGAGEPKYLNSPDTPLFDKGRTLYNLDLAAPASRKSGRILLVEGYMDAIALAQAGIGDVVAPLGTALTEHQIDRLWRMCDVPVVCLDGDSAGRKAAVRAALRALPGLLPAKSLRFAMLPAGQDPDDVVRASGPGAFEAMIAQAQPLVDRLWSHECEATPLTTPEARAGLRKRIDDHVATIGNENVRHQYRLELRKRFDAMFEQPKLSRPRFEPGKRGKNIPASPERPVTASARAISGDGVDHVYARAIIAGLLRFPAMIATNTEAITALPINDAALHRLRTLLVDCAFDGETLDSHSVLPICKMAGLGDLAKDLLRANGLAFSFTARQADEITAQRDLGMAIEALAARPALDAALAAATAALGDTGDESGFAEQMLLLRARRHADQQLAMLAGGETE